MKYDPKQRLLRKLLFLSRSPFFQLIFVHVITGLEKQWKVSNIHQNYKFYPGRFAYIYVHSYDIGVCWEDFLKDDLWF